MDGILLVHKPKGFTSHDVVALLRGVLHTKKIGHTGTLDPDATGLLVLGIGKGTKIMKYLNQDDKTYQATVCIGKTTDTLDHQGTVIEEKEVTNIPSLKEVIASFQGTYIQTPPMYSAIKYKGKRLYEYARQGIVIDDIPSRTIEIIDINQIHDIIRKDGCVYADYVVHASKGLYVRTLSYDIGQKVGYPAYNYQLHRTQAGAFTIADSFTLEQIRKGDYSLISCSDSLSDLPSVIATEDIKKDVSHGRLLSPSIFTELTKSKIVDEDNNLLAIYDKHPTKHAMKAESVFV